MRSYLALMVVVVVVSLGTAHHFHAVVPANAQTIATDSTGNEASHEPISAAPPEANKAPEVISPHVAAGPPGNASTMGNGDVTSVTLQRAPNGHFFADVTINGATIHALVDTGATSVVFSRDDAARVGISPNPSDFTGTAMTANGEARFAPVTLSSVSLGGLTRNDVRAAVMSGNNTQSLLGMTFLSKFKVSIDGDNMVLN